MLDKGARRMVDPVLNRMAARIAARGIGANTITLWGLAFGLLAAGLIVADHSGWALAALFINRLFDGLDGAVARQGGKTDFGGYLDIFCDFIFYAAIPVAFGLQGGAAGAAAAVLVATFYINAASFLGFAILAERRGMTTTERGEKSLYFTAGLMEGSETIGFFVAMCLWPACFVWLAAVFAGLCLVTALARVFLAWREFS